MILQLFIVPPWSFLAITSSRTKFILFYSMHLPCLSSVSSAEFVDADLSLACLALGTYLHYYCSYAIDTQLLVHQTKWLHKLQATQVHWPWERVSCYLSMDNVSPDAVCRKCVAVTVARHVVSWTRPFYFHSSDVLHPELNISIEHAVQFLLLLHYWGETKLAPYLSVQLRFIITLFSFYVYKIAPVTTNSKHMFSRSRPVCHVFSWILPFQFHSCGYWQWIKHNIWCFCMLLGYNYQQKDFQRDKIMSTFDSEWRSDRVSWNGINTELQQIALLFYFS